MLAILSLLVIVSLSLLITRIGTIALSLTGTSKELAFFQAFSAFSGVGFTTTESEQVVGHPVRRRILMILMLAGNVGVVTAVSSLILTFVQVETTAEWLRRMLYLGFGLLILFLLASSKWINRPLSRLIGWGLRRWTHLDVYDYESLLQISDGYAVREIVVREGDWLANKPLSELNLNQEGALVLGTRRSDGTYLGSPTGDSYIYPEDTLILYGRQALLADLDHRKRGIGGEGAHQQAMAIQRDILEEQAERDTMHRL